MAYKEPEEIKNARNRILKGQYGFSERLRSSNKKLKVDDNFRGIDVIGDLPVYKVKSYHNDSQHFKIGNNAYMVANKHLEARKKAPKERLKSALGTNASPKLQSKGIALQGSKSSGNLKLTPGKIKQMPPTKTPAPKLTPRQIKAIKDSPKGALPAFVKDLNMTKISKGKGSVLMQGLRKEFKKNSGK